MVISGIGTIGSMHDKFFSRPAKVNTNPFPDEVIEKIPEVGALSVVGSSFTDEEVAAINEVGILPRYAQVIESEDGYRLGIATDFSDGNHIIPKGYQMKNTIEGKTFFNKIV